MSAATCAAALRARLDGRVLEPGDPGFADATRLWNGMVRRRPALAVQPRGADDVAHALRAAREAGLPVAVRGGGHNIAGTAAADGGLTIDMGLRRRVEVDPARRLAVVQTGCRLGDVDRATQRHGLATPLGFVSEVGVAGLTLGGGLGYLTRRFGWTVDDLVAAEVVTPDGVVRRAAADADAELLWAVRGAGANVGVATSLTFRLHEVGPVVVGGLVAWPFERADDVLAAYRDLTAAAPRHLAVWLVLLSAPPAPFVPPAWHGRRVCAMAVCHSGAPGTAERDLAPLQALGTPVFDLVGPVPYAELQSVLDATEPAGQHFYWKTEYLEALPDGLLATLRDLAAECPVPEAQIGVLHLGGALNERAEDDGAVGNRSARFAVGINGMWAPGDPAEPAHRDWVRAAWERVRPFSTGRTYINFQTEDEGEDRVRASYGENFARVAAAKARYDPDDVLRSNRHVRPAVPA